MLWRLTLLEGTGAASDKGYLKSFRGIRWGFAVSLLKQCINAFTALWNLLMSNTLPNRKCW